MLSSYLVELVKEVGIHSSTSKQALFFFGLSFLILIVVSHNVLVPGLS